MVKEGANDRKLRSLYEDRQKHYEIIDILICNMINVTNCQPLNEEGADRLAKQ
jgi:hypothetical protein